jgi:hypothetical protein
MLIQPFGGDTGGGYQWQAAPAYQLRVRRNIGAITLGQESNLMRLATMRDGAMIPDANIKALIVRPPPVVATRLDYN